MLDALLALNTLDTRVFDAATASFPNDGVADYITVPDAHLLFSGQFQRVGTAGLKITGDDGASFFVENYFSGEKHKHLLSPEGAMLSAHVVESLAGPLAPGQFAQAGAQPAAQPVIGRVDALSGSATVVRNGVSVSLNVGELVRKGDVVQTSASSSVSIVLTDGSTFSLSPNARMVLNEFVYDANASNNSAVFNLVQGTFGFVAGQVAKTGDMRVETPVATMGIRGTAVLVEISSNDGRTKFSVMVEPNGTTGSFNLYNKTTGALIATVNNSNVGWLVTPVGPLEVVANQVQKTPAELQFELGIVQQLFNIFNNYQQNPIDPQQLDPNRRGDLPNDPQNTGSIGSGGALTTAQQTNFNVTITQIPNNFASPQNLPNPNAPANVNTPNPNSPVGSDGPGTGLPPVRLQTGTFNVINGTSGNDHITGTPGDDFVFAGDGDDLITAGHGAGNDIYDGGPGHDTIEYPSATNGVIFHLNVGTTTLPDGQVVKLSTADGVDVGHDKFVRIEKIVGSPGNDIFVLHDGADWEIDAGAGIDIVRFAGGLDLVNTPGGPEIINFEIVDLKTDQTVDSNGISNIVDFDVSELGQFGTVIGGHKVLRVLGDSHDRLSVGNEYGLQGTWSKAPQTVSSDSVFLTDDLTDGVQFDVYTWTFGGKTETVYVQSGIIINNAPVFDDGPKTNVFGNFALTEFNGVESLKLSTGAEPLDAAFQEDLLEFKLGLAPSSAGSNFLEQLSQGVATPTKGSGASFDFQLNAGESVTTQWLFDTNDYVPFNDFAFVAITYNGQIVSSSLLSSVSQTGDYGQTQWTFMGFTAPTDGIYHVTFGVLDSGDGLYPTDLYIAAPHITLAPIVEDNGVGALPGGLQLLQLLGRLGLSAEPETEWLQATRFVQFSDADPFDVHSVQVELTGSNPVGYVSAELVLVGGVQQIRLDYLIDNKDVQYLAAGQNLYQDVRIVLSDGTDFAEKYYTVAIKGQNDNPEIEDRVDEYSVSAPAGTPGVPLVFSNNFAFTDLDINDTHTVTFTLSAGSNVTSSLGTFVPTKLADTANGTGGLVHWQYTVDPALVNALEHGTVRVEAYDVTVSDGRGGSSTHQITITLNGLPNQAPVANGETLAGPFSEDTPFTFSSSLLLANDTDADGDGLIVLGFGGGEDAADSAATAHGGTIAFSDGGITYTPAANYNGPDSFIYWISDQHGGFRQATATLNVAPVNDLPVTNAASGSGAEDTAIAIVLSGSDIEGTLTSFRITTLPGNGSLFYDAAGTQAVVTSGGTADITANANSITLYFKPAADWNGSTSLSYVAVDAGGAIGNTVTAPITVTAVNDAPSGADKTITILEDNGHTFTASDFGYSDVEGDVLEF